MVPGVVETMYAKERKRNDIIVLEKKKDIDTAE